jgi:glucose-1-phosphate thymidylyltransferase
MKAIIPVAGAGKKLRPHTYTQPKALIPIAGKTVLSVIIEQLSKEGLTEFIFIIGYLGEKIQDYVKKNHPDITAHFVQQTNRQGTAHALQLAKDLIQEDEVFIVLGDTICEYNLREVLDAPHSMLGVKKVDDPRDFGVAEIDDNYSITRVVEKPQIPKSNMALVGLYKIKETHFLINCLSKLFQEEITTHGEYNLTDALQCMIEQGAQFKAFKVDNWFDCGKKETLIESNATLLKKFGGKVSEIGNFENTVFIQPVSIADNCVLKNCIIGPNVAIGENVSIENSILKDSIIGAYTKLVDVVLESSLVGSDVFINGITQSLNIGDNTEIDLG